MDIHGFGRLLIILGVLLVLLGVALVVVGRVPFLPRLPGDLVFRRNGITLFVPVVTMIVVSLILTVLLNLFFRFFR